MDRAGLEPDPRLGDHAEDPLGADQHAVGARAGARAGQPAALPGPARGDRAHGLDQVVDVRVERREVPAGAGGDPAAERRELERLREVPQRQPMLAELVLEPRARRPGLDARGPRHGIDLEHAVERAQVERDSTRVAVAHGRLDTANHARPAAVRDRGRARVRAPFEHGLALALVARERDHVRRVVEAAAEGAHDVAVGLAVGVRGALVQLGRADLGERGRRLEPRRRQLHVLERYRALDLGVAEAEVRADRGRGLEHMLVRRLLVLEAPAPELASARGRGGRHDA